MTRLLRVLTADPAATEAACVALAGVGMTPSGAHSCGIYVSAADPALAAKALRDVAGVHATWFASSVHGGQVTA